MSKLKIQTVQHVVSDAGEVIDHPTKGFIISGSIYVAKVDADGNPDGGLIGGRSDELSVFSKFGLLKALDYTLEDLKAAVERLTPRPRSENIFRDESPKSSQPHQSETVLRPPTNQPVYAPHMRKFPSE